MNRMIISSIKFPSWRILAGLVLLAFGAAWAASALPAVAGALRLGHPAGGASNGIHTPTDSKAPGQRPAGDAAQRAGTAQGTTTAPPFDTAANAIPEGPKVTRDARMTVEVKQGDFDSKLDEVLRVVPEQGGYVSGSNAETQDGKLRSGVVTFRVPADKFQATIDRLRRLGSVQSLNIGGTDVSEEYVDLQARLRNLEAQRDAQTALLRQASSIQDILNVQQQLARTQEMIERLQGRINYLDRAVAYSTVSLTLREANLPAAGPGADEWGFRTAVLQALHNFVGTINWLVVAAGSLAPVALMAGGLLVVFWRRRPRAAVAV